MVTEQIQSKNGPIQKYIYTEGNIYKVDYLYTYTEKI
jgi:hypothetical protein